MTSKQLREMFLDYFSNYLTVDKFAEHNELERDDALTLLAMGRRYHEQYVEAMNDE